jgi:cytochrome c oxidase assembly protein subunit 15
MVRWLAAATCAGMFVVLVMGAAVTNTGSAEGCGHSWPLCNGQFVPEFTVATAIEYSHRAVTGVESVLVVALTAAMLASWRHQAEAVLLAAVMLGTLVLQAGLGAGAVLWPQAPLMLATHFGVSLVAFASTYLSAAFVFEHTRGFRLRQVTESRSRLKPWAIAAGVYVLGVVYLGAYVRHAGVSLACTDWPLCNGQLVPSLNGSSGIVFAHRVAALGAVVLLGLLSLRARAAGTAATAAAHTFGFSILQALSGALVVWTYLGLFSTLLHAGIMGLLFASLTYVIREAVRLPSRPGRTTAEDINRRLDQPERDADGRRPVFSGTHSNDEAEHIDGFGLTWRRELQADIAADRQIDAVHTRATGAQIPDADLDRRR